MAVSRSALNADIDSISVTKAFPGDQTCRKAIGDHTAYIFYVSVCEKVNRDFYFSNVTGDEANFHLITLRSL